MIFIQVISRVLKEYNIFNPFVYDISLRYVIKKRKEMAIHRSMTKLSNFFLRDATDMSIDKKLNERIYSNRSSIINILKKIYAKLWVNYAVKELNNTNDYDDIEDFVYDWTDKNSIKDILPNFEDVFYYDLTDAVSDADIDYECEYWAEVLDKIQENFIDKCFEPHNITIGT